jgi:serine/threonine protein kinase/formylglycine-generating enzyme required for sulfatase activity
VEARCRPMSAEENAPTIADTSVGGGAVRATGSLEKVGRGSVVFGRYRLERELGRGGMGVVWLAHDERVDVPVALKFLPDVVARDPESVQELKGELRRGLSLTHPGIVRMYSFEEDETGAAIAMEYVDGPTLSSLKLKQPGACFEPDELWPWVEQLCAALDYAHDEARVVHRDLKPRNLMLTSKGRLKIADFGVATSISDTMSRVTIRKDGSGTPPYMSPQQAFGSDPSPSDDVYSLGATLYELLSGRPPFYQGNILAQVQQRVPPSITERREVLKVTGKKAVPDIWEKAIAACLAKEPEDRPRRAGELLDMLRCKRPLPTGGHTKSAPMNPALSVEAIPALAKKRGPQGAAGSEGALRPGGEAEPKRRPVAEEVKPHRFHPPRSDQTLAVALFGTLLAIAAVLWWFQRGPQLDSVSVLPAVPSNPRSDSATPALPVPRPTPQPDDAAMAAAEIERLAAEQVAMDEGRIPAPDRPWTNELGMKFASVRGVPALVGVHEVRVEDYRTFCEEAGRELPPPPEFGQGEDHPVVHVSWKDALAFCEWLTARERGAGRLGQRQRYRMLTDSEWSIAVGLDTEFGFSPSDKNRAVSDRYPWGAEPVPSSAVENLAGEGELAIPEAEIPGYRDGYTHTAPVGRFSPNAQGLYDLGGNVAEWVDDWFDDSQRERTTRGAAWMPLAEGDRLSSYRGNFPPDTTHPAIGFRVAIEMPIASQPPPAPEAEDGPAPVENR